MPQHNDGMPKGVKGDVQAIKRFLSAMEEKKAKKIDAQPQSGNQADDRFAQLVRKYRDQAREQASNDDIIARNMLYSNAVGAHPSVGTIPAALLGYKEPHPEQGQPMGVDISQMTPEDRQRVLSRISLEEQEELARRWEAKMKGGI